MSDVPIAYLLADMAEYARKAIRILGDLDANGLAVDETRELAVIRAVEVVGEAASKLPAEWRAAHTQVPWRRAINMRNILIHGYRVIELPILVDTVLADFPKLIQDLERLLEEQEP